MTGLKWTDAEEIALQLMRKFPQIDPLTVRFTNLRKCVAELEEFDDPGESNEALLEAIQMAWLECYRENRQ